ncbi:hypothetical protein DIPPA_15825 [Diplonema papillatum]|nr:hypothetical protein DIPPA_15825 [Diplonema papillatum]
MAAWHAMSLVEFLWITALLCYWVIGWTFMELARTWPPFASQSLPRRERARYQPSTQQVLRVALLVYASLAALFLSLFGVFYCTLTLSNQTERENFRGTGKPRSTRGASGTGTRASSAPFRRPRCRFPDLRRRNP